MDSGEGDSKSGGWDLPGACAGQAGLPGVQNQQLCLMTKRKAPIMTGKVPASWMAAESRKS